VVCKWRRCWVEQGFSLQDAPRPGRPQQFADWVWALVIAIACELPSRCGLPLGRHFASSVWQVVREEGVVISLRTVQRMLARHHLKPWRYVSWMHPRDPQFVDKARVILDLYAFTRLVDQVMAMEPYRSAPRVFWIVDNGTSHQGHKAARRLQERYPNLILEVHTRQDFDQRLLELEPWIRQLAA
jgi:Homeodomain-like domain